MFGLIGDYSSAEDKLAAHKKAINLLFNGTTANGNHNIYEIIEARDVHSAFPESIQTEIDYLVSQLNIPAEDLKDIHFVQVDEEGLSSTLNGGTSADQTEATTNNLILGEDENDTITISVGVLNSIEEVDGGQGYNRLSILAGETLDVSTVNLLNIDELTGSWSDEIIYGAVGADNIFGYGGYDTLYGNAGDDTFTGGGQNDELHGGADNDTFLYTDGDGTDAIYGDDGYDKLLASDLDDNIYTSALESIEEIDGGLGYNALYLGSSTTLDSSATLLLNIDEIHGSSGDDVIITTAEDEVIYSGTGTDTIDAGAGNDLVIDDLGSDSQVTVADWFASNDNGDYHVENIQTANMILDHTEVNQLIQAMAGMTMPTGGEIDLQDPNNASLASVIAATWESRAG
ncbi:calcium-binding protein [Emcibacter nanhaiensis]|uniref:Calcium-binding protein n=1 Tax=Emcibacter nanhaiensis TaxID=1505037 RepID=A0A501PGK6_9PROT|nr:calcium-binding protein [Emcibacter nanhaiensis]TPD59006.1 calcium-binding protein [Emcibacter nanhaiensis]